MYTLLLVTMYTVTLYWMCLSMDTIYDHVVQLLLLILVEI